MLRHKALAAPLIMLMAALVCSVLAACFVPDRYQATLLLTNTLYTFDFIGELHIVPAYTGQFQEPNSTPVDFAHKVLAELNRVIKERPNATVESRLASDKVLQIHFSYSSPYSQPEATGLFQMRVEGDIVTLTSRPLSHKDKELLRLYTIPSRGKLCVKAFGQVLESNAQRSANLLSRCHEWELDGVDEPIRLVIKFSKPPPK